MTVFTADDFKLILKENGFSGEEIEKNWEKYLEASLAITIDEYLEKTPEQDRNKIIGKENLEGRAGREKVLARFLEHYQRNKDSFEPVLNQLNFKGKIRNYRQE